MVPGPQAPIPLAIPQQILEHLCHGEGRDMQHEFAAIAIEVAPQC